MDDDDNNNNYYSIKVNIITILLLKLPLSVYPFCVKYSKNTPKYSILKGGEKAFYHHHTEIQRERAASEKTRSYISHTHTYICIQSVIIRLYSVGCVRIIISLNL